MKAIANPPGGKEGEYMDNLDPFAESEDPMPIPTDDELAAIADAIAANRPAGNA